MQRVGARVARDAILEQDLRADERHARVRVRLLGEEREAVLVGTGVGIEAEQVIAARLGGREVDRDIAAVGAAVDRPHLRPVAGERRLQRAGTLVVEDQDLRRWAGLREQAVDRGAELVGLLVVVHDHRGDARHRVAERIARPRPPCGDRVLS